MTNDIETATENLVFLSRWIDAGNVHRDPEAVTWGRLAKIAEENGEVCVHGEPRGDCTRGGY